MECESNYVTTSTRMQLLQLDKVNNQMECESNYVTTSTRMQLLQLDKACIDADEWHVCYDAAVCACEFCLVLVPVYGRTHQTTRMGMSLIHTSLNPLLTP